LIKHPQAYLRVSFPKKIKHLRSESPPPVFHLPIRANPSNLTRYAHPFRAAFGTLSRFARLWLVLLHPRSARDLRTIKYAAFI